MYSNKLLYQCNAITIILKFPKRTNKFNQLLSINAFFKAKISHTTHNYTKPNLILEYKSKHSNHQYFLYDYSKKLTLTKKLSSRLRVGFQNWGFSY